MGEKLPILQSRKLIPVLPKLGFYERGKEGSHLIFKRERDGALVSLPVHAGATLTRGTLLNIIKQTGKTKAEFVKLLKKKKG